MLDLNDAKKEHIEKRNKLKRDREINDLRVILEKPEGRRFAWRFMEEAGTFSNAFNTNALLMSNNLGKVEMGRFLFTEIMNNFPESFLKMQKEYESERKLDESELKKITEGEND